MTAQLKQHEFKAQWVDDEHGPAVMIEQSDGWGGNDEAMTVIVHPHQLRHICEHFNILAADQQASKTIQTLQRRMVVLRDRIADLDTYMAEHSDHKHADLSYEMTQLGALADLAIEWCHDFAQPVTTADQSATLHFDSEASNQDVQGQLL